MVQGISRHVTSKTLDSLEIVSGLTVSDLPRRPSHSTVVLVKPNFFDRRYKINPYMKGDVDTMRAQRQWEQLRDTYERIVDDLRVLDPAETYRLLDDTVAVPGPSERPDMVFVANHAVPTPDGQGVVLARMAKAERVDEPRYFEAWAREQGYTVHHPPSTRFEGMGDALWHPNRRLLWGGHGVRTEREAYDELAEQLDISVIPIELTDERYYHLDVCMAPLSESTVLIQPDAFTDTGLKKIESVFEQVLTAPRSEATDQFSVNAEVVDETVIMSSETPKTAALLEDAGFTVEPVDTSEFMKAGGSVCCLSFFTGAPA